MESKSGTSFHFLTDTLNRHWVKFKTPKARSETHFLPASSCHRLATVTSSSSSCVQSEIKDGAS